MKLVDTEALRKRFLKRERQRARNKAIGIRIANGLAWLFLGVFTLSAGLGWLLLSTLLLVAILWWFFSIPDLSWFQTITIGALLVGAASSLGWIADRSKLDNDS